MTKLEKSPKKPAKQPPVSRTTRAVAPRPGPKIADPADEPQAEKLSVLATKLRWLRAKGNLTLQELSQRSGISQSTLSKIENGQLSPTYEKIAALAKGLGVEVGELFKRSAPGAAYGRRGITRRGEGVVHVSPQYDYEVLCADLSGTQFLPLFTTIKAHSVHEFPTLQRHDGEEFVYVVRGEVVLHSEFYEPLTLRVGDSCYFDSSMGHALVSAGPEDAAVLWVVCSKEVTMPLSKPRAERLA